MVGMFIFRNFVAFLTIAVLVTTEMAWAESRLQAGGTSPQASLDFRITLPTLLYLQIGSTGATVDRITFTLNNIPGTGQVPGTSNGTCPVPVRAAGLMPRGQTISIRANSNSPLTNGTENIRFDNIRWTGSDNRTGTYRFSYDNDEYHGSGAYHGRVTYTLSSHLKGSRQNQCLIMNQ